MAENKSCQHSGRTDRHEHNFVMAENKMTVDDVLSKYYVETDGKLEIDITMQQAKRDLLAIVEDALPKDRKSIFSDSFNAGYNKCLSDVRTALRQVFGVDGGK